MRVRDLENALEARRQPWLILENQELKQKIQQQQDELEIVSWYLSVMEDGVDTRTVVAEYAKLQKKHKQL